jgi:putative SOS response-associated peptidase YedK
MTHPMCARFTLSDPGRLAERYPGYRSRAKYPPRFNIAPTQDVLAVRAADGGELVTLRWGLVPSWADDPTIGQRLINARVETLAEKRAFREALVGRRCAIFADGFFEWTGAKDRRQPYRITVDGGEPFAFAGLYDRWEAGDNPLETCTIVTCPANALVEPLHDRMPAILTGAQIETWLHGTVDEALAAVVPFDPRHMEAYPVTPQMNHHAFDDPRAIAPIPPLPTALTLFD